MSIKKNPVVMTFSEPSRTKQSFKAECDINNIMKRFKKTQGTEFLSQYAGYVGGTYGDFSNVTDYRSAIEQVRSAEDVFMALPAVVRATFANDTARFLDFVQNPANANALVEMGLAAPKDVNVTPVNTPSSTSNASSK